MKESFASRYATWVLRFPASLMQVAWCGVIALVFFGLYLAHTERKLLLTATICWLVACIDALFRIGVKEILDRTRSSASSTKQPNKPPEPTVGNDRGSALNVRQKMEQVKTLDSIFQPDTRRTVLEVRDHVTGEYRPISLSDIERRIADIRFSLAAPEEVTDLLIAAKNLLLYSWYYYPFSMTAALQASVAVERGLKVKLMAKPRDSLTFLLRRAINEGLITETGFPRWAGYRKEFRRLHGHLPAQPEPKLTDVLLDTFPYFRNTVAHGDGFLDDIGFQQLDIANEIIWQLFPESRPSESPEPTS